ncbi:MAG: FG-GAP repeat protein [Phycisphaeraceae bacterium]|nr:FG-GAP repeat protein [Phycisphaeraceae bacterium]MCW5763000.1 FG-GAP repeat protein [Phycisphaeraceae bacterium]
MFARQTTSSFNKARFAPSATLALVCGLASFAAAGDCPGAGTILTEQRISNTSGGFGGTIAADSFFGRAAVAIGDVDGDGVTDLAIGSYGDADGGLARGAVWIVFMNADGTVKGQQKISSTTGGLVGPPNNNAGFGYAIAPLGDMDNDGVPDIAVGAYRENDGGANRGAVYIIRLNANGTVKSQQKISSTQGGFTGPLLNADWFGTGVAAIGDLDGDGIIDIAVGTELDKDGGTNRGAVYILMLNANGTVKAEQKISSTQGGLTGPLLDNDRFGNAVAGIGDIDGDGIPDIIVGAYRDSDGGTARGAAYVLMLNADGTVKDEQKISSTQGGLTGPIANTDWFGSSVAAIGDIDGDGVVDIAVGAQQNDDGGMNHGAVYVLRMNSDGTVKSEQRLSSTTGGLTGPLAVGDVFGSAVGAIGDFDGDGIPDLIVGAMQADDGATDAGAVFLLTLDGCESSGSGPVVITTQPASLISGPAPSAVQFSVVAEGAPTISYQWRRDTVPLSNGGGISGATTATLTVTANSAAIGVYDCVVTNSFGSETSDGAILAVRPWPCLADLNQDGNLDFFDVQIFLQAFAAGCP